VQKITRKPRQDNFVNATFPALEVTIGYAERETALHKWLLAGQCQRVLKMEVSFREPVHAVHFVRLDPTRPAGVHAYSLIDLIAEKLRALLQQDIRNRNRRQDIYDLHFLICSWPPTQQDTKDIRDALVTKCRARGIDPNIDSFSDPAVRARAKADWHTLDLEIGDLPDFDHAFSVVQEFYRRLPW
jgi:predicted nucleotidyltransferase component of viral defense system